MFLRILLFIVLMNCTISISFDYNFFEPQTEVRKNRGVNSRRYVSCDLLDCSTKYRPVCGMKNITYRNACAMICESADQLKHEGECVAEKKECQCSDKQIDFVCGVNGKDYQNKCSLDCELIKMAYPGKCMEQRELDCLRFIRRFTEKELGGEDIWMLGSSGQ